MKVLGISGSLRRGSLNTALLRAIQSAASPDIRLEIADLRSIPVYDEDVYLSGFPAGVQNLRRQIQAADALLIATPEYNYSVPGVLKNAIDWASRPPEQPFAGKPVALVGAAASALGSARAQYHLRQVFVFLNGHVLNQPELMVPGAAAAFDELGNLADENVRERIAGLLQALGDWTRRVAPTA